GLARRTDASGSVYELRDLDRRLLSERTASATYYVIPDAVGSTIGLTEANGGLAATWTYDPFGNTISQTGSVSTPVLFQGGYIDPDGNYKMGDRFYDPTTGRYLQVDNQQGGLNPQTLNRYVFELNNPVNNPAITLEQPTGA
ncbi:MAG TPA: RHS repeat-associated core domain-containing protein, partial [Candidatus Eisenbacteria bacterium]|nr:RHS repeat-associated core domain-containing protein [Candidatus Eisenbacteria bacterium]